MSQRTMDRRRAFATRAATCLLFAAAFGWAAFPASSKPKEIKPQGFATPEAAVQAFVDAARGGDSKAFVKVFGSAGEDIISSGDEVQDAKTRQDFLSLYDESHAVATAYEDQAELIVGKDHWPFPVPIVKVGKKWYFDTEAGREEILNRRIGRNELNTLGVLEAFVEAQREYMALDYDQDEVVEYAPRVWSTPDRRDGLYWPVGEEEDPSPFGPLVAKAAAEGYQEREGTLVPYHGYYFKILTAQGPDAAGGALSYVVNDNMVAGYAMVAWPADYGNSGIMTFLVNANGIIYQKDLGERTAESASAMNQYNPNATWMRAR